MNYAKRKPYEVAATGWLKPPKNEEENVMKKVLDYSKLAQVSVTELETGGVLYTQSPRSFVCTQCSVAVVLGISLKQSFDLFGHSEASNLDEACNVFEKIGYEFAGYCGKIDNRVDLDISGKGIMRIYRKHSKMGHMVAFVDGKIYDSTGYVFNSLKELRETYYKDQGTKWFGHYALKVREGNGPQ